MVGIEGAHGFLTVQLGVLLVQSPEPCEVALQVFLVLNQRLKVENGHQFLTGAEPEQVHPHERVVQAVLGIGH